MKIFYNMKWINEIPKKVTKNKVIHYDPNIIKISGIKKSHIFREKSMETMKQSKGNKKSRVYKIKRYVQNQI